MSTGGDTRKLQGKSADRRERVVKLSGDAVHGFGAPVLAVCGFSGAGKTTLLESAIPRLKERGLAVAVVKHHAHGFEVDRAGKDSDRLLRAGATIALSGPQEQFEWRGSEATLSLEATLARLGRDHDLLLVEGHKDTPLPKFWLGKAGPAAILNIATPPVCGTPGLLHRHRVRQKLKSSRNRFR
jgi:molybdopterin-guanine dinucleotide biosynthesis protein MobB